MKVKIRSTQAKPKQQQHDEVANKVSKRQIQKNIVRSWGGGGGGKGKEPKYGDRIVEIKRTRQSN